MPGTSERTDLSISMHRTTPTGGHDGWGCKVRWNEETSMAIYIKLYTSCLISRMSISYNVVFEA